MRVQIRNVRDAEIIHDMHSGSWSVDDSFRAFEKSAEVLVEVAEMSVLPRENDAIRLPSPRGEFTYIVLGCLLVPLREARTGEMVIDTAIVYVHSEDDETNADWMLREGGA